MGNLFGYDTPIGSRIIRLCDLILLNVVYIICCLPIFTVGAANTALYYVTLRMQRDEENGVFKDFFSSFSRNFKQSLGLTVVFIGSGLMILLNIYLFHHMELGILNVCVYVLYLALIIHCVLFAYVFPVFARYDNSVKNTLKNALILSIRYPVNSVVVTLIANLPLIGILLFPQIFYYIAFTWLFLMFALQAYWNASLFRRIFDQLEGTQTHGEVCD